MYYRWTEKATIIPPEKRGKWIRTTHSKLLTKYPQYLIWVRSGHMEIKDESSTAKQIAQRKMWQMIGRTVGLTKQMRLLAAELRANFPDEYDKYMSDMQVISHFYNHCSNIDMGLMLKKYHPNLYNSTAPS